MKTSDGYVFIAVGITSMIMLLVGIAHPTLQGVARKLTFLISNKIIILVSNAYPTDTKYSI